MQKISMIIVSLMFVSGFAYGAADGAGANEDPKPVNTQFDKNKVEERLDAYAAESRDKLNTGAANRQEPVEADPKMRDDGAMRRETPNLQGSQPLKNDRASHSAARSANAAPAAANHAEPKAEALKGEAPPAHAQP